MSEDIMAEVRASFLANLLEENKRLREALEKIIEECRDDFCVKNTPGCEPPCSCGIASKALRGGGE